MIERVYDSKHLLVVLKPSGVPTTSPRDGDSLTRRLEAEVGAKLHPSSRLDAEVTGLVTYARTKVGITTLTEARQAGRYHRVYLALAAQAPEAETGAWDASIAIEPRDRRLRMAVPPGGRGERLQTALTHYRVHARTPHAAALHLEPQTGRTHQLRVHAAHAGIPLLGDVRYGGARRLTLDDGRMVRAARVMLHCWRLRIPNGEGEMLSLAAEIPDDFARVWRALGGDKLD